MKIFLDTADIEEIRTAARWGVLDGVTTNPTLYAKVGGSYDDDPPGDLQAHAGSGLAPRSSPRTSTACSRRAAHFAKLAPNIVVKVPMSEDGPRGDQPLRRGGHQDQLHAHLHAPTRGCSRRRPARG